MLIQVNYLDNRFDFVNRNVLDELIESRQITGFRRDDGWVTLGFSPVREARRNQSCDSQDLQ